MTLKEKIMSSLGTSYWLKDAVRALDGRDPVDALHDAQALLAVCSERLSAMEVL